MDYKIIKIFVTFLFIVIFPLSANAIIMLPLANLTIVVNTQEEEAAFHFNLDLCQLGNNCNNVQKLDLQTQNLSASTFTQFASFPGNNYLLTQDSKVDLNISSINCTSDNPNDSFVYQSNSVSFSSIANENINCVFTNTKKKTPVLIIPGLLGTEMKNDSELLWPNLGKMFTDIGDNFMDPLRFDANLNPINNNLTLGNVIGSPAITQHFYDLLINEFKNQGYVENQDIFTFPYDWRYGVSGKFTDGTTNVDVLSQKIKDIMQATGSDKVDVIAHSTGGLLIKKYIVDYSQDYHIGKAIFVGVPNTGAPKAIKVFLQGDNFGIPWLSDSEMKKIAENLPVAYDLSPSQQYYDGKGSFVKVVEMDISNLSYIAKDLNYEETQNFLIQDHGLNLQALDGAKNLHTKDFDNFDLRNTGVDVYNIDGCKTGTLGKITEVRIKNLLGMNLTDYKKPKFVPGDGTVPLESATNLPVDQSKKYYALKSDHSKMLSAEGIRQEIVNILTGSNLGVSDKIITQNIDQCKLNGKAIAVFSPVDISIIDQDGNRLGLADDQSIINQIPGADFEIIDGHKFIYLPIDEDQTYTISIVGTGTGTFTIETQDINNNQETRIESFVNIPVTQELTGQINLSSSLDIPTTLTLKANPQGEVVTILPSAVLDSSQAEDFIAPISKATLTGDLVDPSQPEIYKNDIIIQIESADQIITGNKSQTSGVLDIEYNLDDKGFQKITGGLVNFMVSDEGQHSLVFYSTDKIGNNEAQQTINFTIIKSAQEPSQINPSSALASGYSGALWDNTNPIVLNLNNQNNENNTNEAVISSLQPISDSIVEDNPVVPMESVISESNFEEITIAPEIQSVVVEEDSSTQSIEAIQANNSQPLVQNLAERPNVFLASIGSFANILGSKIIWIIASIITIFGLAFLFIKR